MSLLVISTKTKIYFYGKLKLRMTIEAHLGLFHVKTKLPQYERIDAAAISPSGSHLRLPAEGQRAPGALGKPAKQTDTTSHVLLRSATDEAMIRTADLLGSGSGRRTNTGASFQKGKSGC